LAVSQLAYTFIITLQIFQLQSIVASEKIYSEHQYLYKVKVNKILLQNLIVIYVIILVRDYNDILKHSYIKYFKHFM